MEKTKNSRYKKNKHGAHVAHSSKTNRHYFILFLIILFIIVIGIYFMVPYISSKEEHNNNKTTAFDKLTLSGLHKFENNKNLSSENLSITVENGLTKVRGTIINNSNDTLEELYCIYTLFDSSTNAVYEFRISVLKIEANSSCSFSSVCIEDLSDVTNYSVKLAE